MSNFLLYQQEGGVVTLTMNSPATRNVLTGNSAPHEFSEACARINTNTSVRVVILTGAGPAFSAGGNLKDMQAMFDLTPAQLREWYRHGVQRLALAVYGLEVPVILAREDPRDDSLHDAAVSTLVALRLRGLTTLSTDASAYRRVASPLHMED